MPQPGWTLDTLNALDRAGFCKALDGVFEHAPWVAEAVAGSRPFVTIEELHTAMMTKVRTAPVAEQIAFLQGHPELAGRQARTGDMAEASVAEQGSLGLDRLSESEFQRFEILNAAYTQRFGIPFIICVRRQTRASILDAFERRLANSVDVERDQALAEIEHITRLRLDALMHAKA